MLRSIISSSLILLFLTFSTSAQSLIGYGVKFGAAVSDPIWTFENDSPHSSEIEIGADVGFFLNWSLTNRFSLLTEMHFIQKGIKYNITKTNLSESGMIASITKVTIHPNVNYLSVPIYLKYDLVSSEVNPYLIAGLRVDFDLSENNSNEYPNLYLHKNNVDFGGSIGLGLQTKSILGIGTGIELKYSPSFVKYYSPLLTDIKNRTYEFSFILYN